MFEKHTNCIICNNAELREINKYKNNYLVKCSKCGFVFCSSVPTMDELVTHYENYKRDNVLSPITVKRYNKLLDIFEKYRSNNNLLDIGCGDGHFLSIAQKRGWNVYGTEFTDEAVSVCQYKKIIVHKGKLNPLNYLNMKFDVVTSFEVIEHINNPLEEINNIKTILRKRGAFYLTTPNFNSISRYVLKENWHIIEYPEHLSYYTNSTIKRLLTQSGFKKKFLHTHGINNFLCKGRKKSNPILSNKEIETNFRKTIEGSFFLRVMKSILNYFLSFFKIGDSLKALFILD